MNGTIAQLVALVCHGNALLHDMSSQALTLSNSAFQFCDRVNFVEPSSFLGSLKEKTVAESPSAWFAYLKQEGSKGLWLSLTGRNDPKISDRMSAAFVGGGGTWKIETVHADNTSRFWQSRWEVWNQNAPERRIWWVNYGQVGESKCEKHSHLALTAVSDELRNALADIHAFSNRNSCGGFTACFARALGALDGDPVASGYHTDLAPAGVLSPEAVKILNGCQSGWVFGGMGSWNDMGFEGEEGKAYDRVSERLFRSINAAILAAANSSFRNL